MSVRSRSSSSSPSGAYVRVSELLAVACTPRLALPRRTEGEASKSTSRQARLPGPLRVMSTRRSSESSTARCHPLYTADFRIPQLSVTIAITSPPSFHSVHPCHPTLFVSLPPSLPLLPPRPCARLKTKTPSPRNLPELPSLLLPSFHPSIHPPSFPPGVLPLTHFRGFIDFDSTAQLPCTRSEGGDLLS